MDTQISRKKKRKLKNRKQKREFKKNKVLQNNPFLVTMIFQETHQMIHLTQHKGSRLILMTHLWMMYLCK